MAASVEEILSNIYGRVFASSMNENGIDAAKIDARDAVADFIAMMQEMCEDPATHGETNLYWSRIKSPSVL